MAKRVGYSKGRKGQSLKKAWKPRRKIVRKAIKLGKYAYKNRSKIRSGIKRTTRLLATVKPMLKYGGLLI